MRSPERFLFTRVEAQAFIRRQPSGTEYVVSIRIDAPLDGEEKTYLPDALASYVDVSRNEAVRLVHRLLFDALEARGARLPVRLDIDDYGVSSGRKPSRTVWIG